MNWIDTKDEKPGDRAEVLVTDGKIVALAVYYKLPGDTSFFLTNKEMTVTHWASYHPLPGMPF